MRKFILFAALAAVIMSGCSQSADDTTVNSEANAIDFRPVVEKSRASVVESTDQLTSFFVQADKGSAYDFNFLNAAVYYDGSSWVYSPKKYYPTDGDLISFYAYAPIKDVNMAAAGFTVAGTDVTFGYTVPTDQSVHNTATDLLVAKKTDMSSGTVDFIFDHALSAVTFSAKNLNDENSELTYVISSIKIINVDNEGTYVYAATPTWTVTGSGDVTYKAGVPASGVAVVPGGSAATAVNLLSANDVMMVLPQTPTWGTIPAATTPVGSYVVITYSLKSGDGQYMYENEERYMAPYSGFEFIYGTRYNFEFAFSASDAIVLNVTSVNDWYDLDANLN